MNASKSWLQNEWDTNKQTLLDPDKGLYELTHAKQAVSAARDVAESVDEGAGELLEVLEEIASRDFRGTGWTMTDIVMFFRARAREAITAHKARITTPAPIAQLWENEND